MKKQALRRKRLILSRETVRRLEDLQLRDAAGGVTFGCPTFGECGTVPTCNQDCKAE